MKTICIYHSRDLDGWMSGAIVKLKYPEVELIGWDYGQPIPILDPQTGDDIVMADISFPSDVMCTLQDHCNFVWIDHHISAIKDMLSFYGTANLSFVNGIRDSKFAACELTWKYFFPEQKMPEMVRLLGRYDCFGHKGTDEEQTVLEFQYGARSVISNVQDAYEYLTNNHVSYDFVQYTSATDRILDIGRSVYKYLCTEARQTYSMIFPVYFDGHKFACVNQVRFNPINFGINYHRDGYDGFACFHFQNGQFTYSLYNDNGKVDCSEICKKRGGGGHKGAAGFRSKTLITA